MNRLVYSVFKAIMMSMIFIFVFDMAFYMYRCVSLNTRMETISTSMQKVVMENNYLPQETANLYVHMFADLINTFNGGNSKNTAKVVDKGNGAVGLNVSLSSDASDVMGNSAFIAGLHWNYGSDAKNIDTLSNVKSTVGVYNSNGKFTEVEHNIISKDMSKSMEYGDIQVVQLRVAVYQPIWGWGSSSSAIDENYHYNGQDATQWNRHAYRHTTEFTYTYYVPCLRYKTTNQ